jgi:gamma-glutamylputrescine oxidase
MSVIGLHSINHNRADSYFEASAQRGAGFSALRGSVTADVCVIGGGIAGCSTALELAKRGYRTVLIEARRVGWGASGRSGGQVIPGFASDQETLTKLLGSGDAKRLWDMSVEAIALLRSRIDTCGISCDWRDGHLQVAVKSRQGDVLRAWHEQLERHYGYSTTRLLDGAAVGDVLGTRRYCAALYDSSGGHLHPLKYTLGLASGAQTAGAIVHEQTPALSFRTGPTVVVTTPQGVVNARFVVFCGNAYLGNLAPQLADRIMAVRTYMIATESLGTIRAQELIRNDSAVMDSNFILDYFRRSADDRLLFGGRVSYSGHDTFDTTRSMRKRMLRVFPQLANAKIEFTWSGLLDVTLNRAPDFGRIGNNIYYLQGFSGHGIALAGLAGKLAAEAIAGQTERFDLFGKIKHRAFPGGPLLRTPALVLAMLWYRVRDLL